MMTIARTIAARTSRPARRAALATTLFATVGIVTACRGDRDWAVLAPLGLAYALLIAHTYFSIRFFGAIIPTSLWGQRAIDSVLGATYLGLATSIADAIRFSALAALLFAVATLKYVMLLGRLGADELLARKVRVDTLGTIASVLGLIAAIGGHDRAAAWSLLGLNAIANVYLLRLRPLYRS